MKITFEGTLAEFHAIFRTTLATGASPVKDEPVVPQHEAPGWEYPGDTHFPNPLPPHYGAHSFNGETAVSSGEPDGASPVVEYQLDPELKKLSWTVFVQFIRAWIVGFEEPEVEQPDRVSLMRELGSGRWPLPLLCMAHEIGSLQRLVQQALIEIGDSRSGDLDFVERLSAHLIPLSHVGFPDLAGMHDFSSRWRRVEPKWRLP